MTLSTTEIRRLGEDDASLLGAAVQSLVLSPDSHGLVSRVHLAQALADPRCYFLLYMREAIPVGYLSAYRFPAVEHNGFIVYLFDLVVSPQHRRRGIGTLLVRTLTDICRADGVTRVWVGTDLNNRAARRTFETTGALQVSETYTEYVYDLYDRTPKGTV